MNSSPPNGAHQPTILPPFTPSELLEHLTSYTTYPTTIIICWPKDQFLAALIQDVKQQQQQQAKLENQETESPIRHPLLHASLLQTATARHLNIVFTPTVAHLRAYLATMNFSEIRVRLPPRTETLIKPPLLMVYGLVELHRDGMDWSAQGLSFSTAVLVEAAWQNGFKAVMLEPRSSENSREGLKESLLEKVPVLNGTPVKDDGSWCGPTVHIGYVLGSWFKVGVEEE